MGLLVAGCQRSAGRTILLRPHSTVLLYISNASLMEDVYDLGSYLIEEFSVFYFIIKRNELGFEIHIISSYEYFKIHIKHVLNVHFAFQNSRFEMKKVLETRACPEDFFHFSTH